MIESRRLKWTGYVAKTISAWRFIWETPSEENSFEDLDIEGRVIFN
jgi:hypothetical protein